MIEKMDINNSLSDIYFRGFLEPIAAMLPPPVAYRFLSGTGDKFRNQKTYASGIDAPGALVRAFENLSDASIYQPEHINNIIRQILYFESRFVMENIWIKNKNHRSILKSFNSQDIKFLQKLLENKTYVIATVHTVALYLFVALLHVLEHPSGFIIANHSDYKWKYPTPLVQSSMRMTQEWRKYQRFLFPENKEVMKQSREMIQSGNSLTLCVDTPGYSQGIQVNLFGKRIAIPAGAAKLSLDCGIPMLLAIPYAPSIYEPYRIFLKIIEPVKDIASQMSAIFQDIEAVIRLNPACWSGWFYMDAMAL